MRRAVATVLGLAIVAVLIAWMALTVGHNSLRYATQEVAGFFSHPGGVIKTAEAEIGRNTGALAKRTTDTKPTGKTGQVATTVTQIPKPVIPPPAPNPYTTVPLYQPTNGSKYGAEVVAAVNQYRKTPIIESSVLDQLAAQRVEKEFGTNDSTLPEDIPYMAAIQSVMPDMTWGGEELSGWQGGVFTGNPALDLDVRDDAILRPFVEHDNGTPVYVGAAILEGKPPNPYPENHYYYYDIIFASQK